MIIIKLKISIDETRLSNSNYTKEQIAQAAMNEIKATLEYEYNDVQMINLELESVTKE